MTVPAGSQVYWDSRTVHSGIEFLPEVDCPPTDKPRPIRIVAYLCYEPRTGPDLLGTRALARPAKTSPRSWRSAAESLILPTRCSCGWPNKMGLFAGLPRTYGASQPAGCTRGDAGKYWSFVPTLPAPVLTSFGRLVAGLA